MTEICFTCLNISGQQRISPGPFIYTGQYWVVDHAYPSSLLGWLVILPKRHITAMHEITFKEFQELAEIEYKLVQVIHKDPTIEKKYFMCFAEGEGFHHVHFHMVPKPYNLPHELIGPRVFAFLNTEFQPAIAAPEIIKFCEAYTKTFQQIDL